MKQIEIDLIESVITKWVDHSKLKLDGKRFKQGETNLYWDVLNINKAQHISMNQKTFADKDERKKLDNIALIFFTSPEWQKEIKEGCHCGSHYKNLVIALILVYKKYLLNNE